MNVFKLLPLLLLTGCASYETSQHTLVCVLLCLEMDTAMKKGDTPKDAAPTSLDGLVLTPQQREAHQRRSSGAAPAPPESTQQ
jgi:hypothetical protein